MKQARERKKLTQAQLAFYAGVDQQTISRVERGQTRNVAHRVVMCVCAVLGVEPSSIAEFRVDTSGCKRVTR
jgi:transcriptional regulator with XRE-family HTH domain